MKDPANPSRNQHEVGRWPRSSIELLIDLLEKRVVSRDHEFRYVEVTVVSKSILPQWNRVMMESHRYYVDPTDGAELASSGGMPPEAAGVV